MSDVVVTRDLPPLTLRAAFVPSTINADTRTVDVTWSTGARALRRFDPQLDIWKPFYEELSLERAHVRLDRFNNGAPLSDGHPAKYGDFRAAMVRGVIVAGSAKVNGKAGTATVRFATAGVDPDADVLFRKIEDGIVQHVSVGYRIYKAQQVEKATDTIPTFRVIDWEPVELSTVSVGEDDGATFRSRQALTLTPCDFVTCGQAPRLADADRGRRLRLAQAQLSQ